MKNDINLHILLVEDEAITAQYMKNGLTKFGFSVTAVSSSDKALEKIREHKPDLILMDVHLAGELNGFDTMKKINQLNSIPVIYITGYVDENARNNAQHENVLGFLTKPININEIITIIKQKGLI